jgi:hypothetical protein
MQVKHDALGVIETPPPLCRSSQPIADSKSNEAEVEPSLSNKSNHHRRRNIYPSTGPMAGAPYAIEKMINMEETDQYPRNCSRSRKGFDIKEIDW